MSEDSVNNRSDSPRETYVDPRDLGKGGRLLINQRPNPRVPFQQILDQVKTGSPASDTLGLPNTTARTLENPAQTQQAVQPVVHQHQEERGRGFREELNRRSRDNDAPHESSKGRTSAADGERPKGKVASEKVIARAPLSERQRDGQGKGQEKGNSKQGEGQPMKTWVFAALHKSLHKGKIQELGQSAFLQQVKNLQAPAEKSPRTPTGFTKALLDQIVHYVRLLTRADGEKEMDVSLHENVFKGLRLKVAMASGKTDVTFLTPTEEIRTLFLAHREELSEALKEKEIEVRSLNVIMIQSA